MNSAYHDSPVLWKHLLATGLSDDAWQWDWTSIGTLGTNSTKKVHARIIAKSEGVWAADGLLRATEELSREMELPIKGKLRVKSGQVLKKGQVVVEWTGPARSVLALERPFLNLASYAGGIATHTRALVQAVDKQWKIIGAKGPAPRVTSTRKILPHYRDLAIHAVQAGGGWSHRVSLSGGVLIKENHIAAAGGIVPAIRGAKAVAPHGLKIEIEVTSHAELKQALAAGADGFLLDNFTPEMAATAVKIIRESGKSIFTEISGGVHEGNIKNYVLEGINVISSGSLTHSVKAIDLSLLVDSK